MASRPHLLFSTGISVGTASREFGHTLAAGSAPRLQSHCRKVAISYTNSLKFSLRGTAGPFHILLLCPINPQLQPYWLGIVAKKKKPKNPKTTKTTTTTKNQTSTVKPKGAEIKGISTGSPSSCQMSGGQEQPEQLVAAALAHRRSHPDQKPEALMTVPPEGGKTARGIRARCQGRACVSCPSVPSPHSPSHLLANKIGNGRPNAV